jgi:hypothetical protein
MRSMMSADFTLGSGRRIALPLSAYSGRTILSGTVRGGDW